MDLHCRVGSPRLEGQLLPLRLEVLESLPRDQLRPAGDHRQSPKELRLLDGGAADDHHLVGPELADDELELLGIDPHRFAVVVEVHLEDETGVLHLEDSLPTVVVTMCG